MRGTSPCCRRCGGLVISDGPFRNGTDTCCTDHFGRLCDRCLRMTHQSTGRAA
jgi:hypothetical protein